MDAVFLRQEVENEERIDMALTGFGLSTEQDKAKKMRNKTNSPKEAVSASTLLVVKERKG